MKIPKYIQKRADFICSELGIIDSEHQSSAVRLAIIKEYKRNKGKVCTFPRCINFVNKGNNKSK